MDVAVTVARLVLNEKLPNVCEAGGTRSASDRGNIIRRLSVVRAASPDSAAKKKTTLDFTTKTAIRDFTASVASETREQTEHTEHLEHTEQTEHLCTGDRFSIYRFVGNVGLC